MDDILINIANSNGEYFKNTMVSDAVIKAGLESQNILIGPFNGGENCVMQIKNTGMTINGNILSTGEITTSNISVDVLKFSNSIIKYDSNISNIVFGTSSNMVSMGGLLYAGSNLSDVGNIKTARGNIGMSSNDSVSFSNVSIGGTMEANKLGGNCISSFTNSTLQTTAASSAAVKTVYDLASIANNVATTASNVANAALPKAGGIVTGDVILLGTGTQILGAVADTIISPTFSWTDDSNTGLYHDAVGSIGVTINGLNKAKINISGLTVAGNIEASSLSGTCINSNVNSSSQITAASSAAVKTVYDLATIANNVATTASNVANAALPKAGGIVTGDVILLGTGTQILGAVADTIISPTFSWTDDSNTGLYHDAVGSMGIAINGLNKAKIDSNGMAVVGNIQASSLSGTCINSNVNSISQTTAASSAAVKSTYDLATLAKTNAALAAAYASVKTSPKISGAIEGGDNHTIVLTSTGTLYGWGSNSLGQLGNGLTANVSSPILINGGAIAGKTITSISCGGDHTVAIDNAGNIYAWGRNSEGQIGNGLTATVLSPILVNGGAIAGKIIVSVSCGYYHTAVLDNTGKLYMWGYNLRGQIGNGTTTNVRTPILINGGAIAGKTITYVKCGGYHTFALENSNLYAWGYNNSGQLGDGLTSATNSTPKLISGGAIVGKTLVSIASGEVHTIAIDNTGTLYAWGQNGQSQLGNGLTTNILTPILINGGAIAGKTIKSLAAGHNNSMVLDNNGCLYACGQNAQGQLGNGLTANLKTFTLIDGGSISGKIISNITGGNYHTIAVDSLGNLYTWGLNTSGQVGDGNTIGSVLTPKLISITQGGTQVLFNFTGQHRCLLEYNNNNVKTDLVGLVVVSDKNKYIASDMTRRYSKPETINDALPVVSLSTKKADKSVFGVISRGIDLGMRIADNNEVTNMSNYSDNQYEAKGDSRLQINSIGEGCIWVIEGDGPIKSGDYVMSSDTPGYSTLQPDDFMRSYTIAKITRYCNWNPQQVPIEITKKDSQGNFVLDPETIQPVFETVTEAETTDENGNVIPEHLQTEDEYTIRYVDSSDGSITTKEAWLVGSHIIKRAALLGCTYHCG